MVCKSGRETVGTHSSQTGTRRGAGVTCSAYETEVPRRGVVAGGMKNRERRGLVQHLSRLTESETGQEGRRAKGQGHAMDELG